jgi:hypothetical protein
LKHSKIGIITLLLFGMVIALTGIVCADQVVPAVPETQVLSMVTTADVVGLALETDAGVWTLTTGGGTSYTLTYKGSGQMFGLGTAAEQALIAGGGSFSIIPVDNLISMKVPESMLNQIVPGWGVVTWQGLLDGNSGEGGAYNLNVVNGGIHTGALDPGQIQYTTAYDANIVAQGGHTSFTKSMNIHTGNKVISQSNLIAQTGLTYLATYDGGNVVGSENLMLDGAGNTTRASDRILCPFVPQKEGNVIPAYCNIVQVGSKYDLTVGSVTTNANERFVGNDAANPVSLNYEINVKPYGTAQGQILASGSTMAYIKAHVQEARDYNYVAVPVGNGLSLLLESTPQKAEDLTYSETSSAQGTITSFNKVIAYQSGRLLL